MLKKYKYLSSALLLSLLIGCGGGDDDDSSGIHNQGKSCASCHDFNGATVFNDKQAADNTLGATGYRVQLGGADVYNISKGVGNSNFYGDATLAKFTAHVIDTNGNIVNSSKSESHDNTRLDCNRCHTPTQEGRLTP